MHGIPAFLPGGSFRLIIGKIIAIRKKSEHLTNVQKMIKGKQIMVRTFMGNTGMYEALRDYGDRISRAGLFPLWEM